MLLALVVITGLATVIDGDTLKVREQTIRLQGIDAPEGRQICRQGSVTVLCGQIPGNVSTRSQRAIWWLAVGRRRIATVAWSLAYRRYSTDYVDEETAARKAGAGMWSMQFQPPWEWRQTR